MLKFEVVNQGGFHQAKFLVDDRSVTIEHRFGGLGSVLGVMNKLMFAQMPSNSHKEPYICTGRVNSGSWVCIRRRTQGG